MLDQLPTEILEEILKYLRGVDLISLAAASETVLRLVLASFSKYKEELDSNIAQASRPVWPMPIFAPISKIVFCKDKIQGLDSVLEQIRSCYCRVVIVATNTIQAQAVARKLTSAGITNRALLGFPTVGFRKRFFDWDETYVDVCLGAVVVTRCGGSWIGWPERVIVLDGPKAFKQQTELATMAGKNKTTWLLCPSKEDLMVAFHLLADPPCQQATQPGSDYSFLLYPKGAHRVASVRRHYADKCRTAAQRFIRKP